VAESELEPFRAVPVVGQRQELRGIGHPP
jgi:hypothetical protein